MANNLSKIIRILNAKPGGSTQTRDDRPHSDNDDIDRVYEDSNKKHRNSMGRLDHAYEIISHPISLISVFLIVLVAFLVFRYFDIYNNGCIKALSQAHEDTKTAMTYLLTIIVTAVFTKFLERNKK